MRACPNNITELLPHRGERRRGEEKGGRKENRRIRTKINKWRQVEGGRPEWMLEHRKGDVKERRPYGAV